ncbi:GHKL domain-containing protein, partial [bacterium]
RTPTVEEVRALASWVTQTTSGEVFSTNHLASFYEPANAFAQTASGLLALSVAHIRPSVVLWFRPEVIETISWGGDPRKEATHPELSGRIHPRKSFETWRETVRQQATPWLRSEIDTAAELRSALLGIVLRKSEELASLSSDLKVTNQSLERTNKELEAFSYSVSHDLRAPLRHIAGYAEILKEVSEGKLDEADRKFVDTIIESCEYAGKLVDNLLAFSQMGRAALTLIPVNMNLLMSEVRQEVGVEAEGRDVVWQIGEMPLVEADVMMLKLAVRNLLSNALKYSRSRPQTVIEVQCVIDRSEAVFSIRDNGVGFDMRYQDKLFGVFQRLHRWEDYEGTGIGLANVRRIVERHGGRAWAEGAVDHGATFYFTLPLAETSAARA